MYIYKKPQMLKALRSLADYIIQELSDIQDEETFKNTFFDTALYKKLLMKAMAKCLSDHVFIGLDSPDVMNKSIIPNFMSTYLHLEIFNRINNQVYARFKKRLEGEEDDTTPPDLNNTY